MTATRAKLSFTLGLPETRPLRFVENIQGAPYVFAIDAALATKTVIYNATFAATTKVYEGALELTRLGCDSLSHFVLGFGDELWTGDKLWNSTTVGLPERDFTFPAALSFVTPTIVGLTDGSLWEKVEGAWERVLEGGGPVLRAASPFRGAGGAARGVAGGATLQLVERGESGWIAGPLLDVPSTVQGSAETGDVSALYRFVHALPPSSEEGEEEPLPADSLLIGTKSGGLLGVLERADPTTVLGAVVSSQLFLPTIDPIMQPEE